MLELSVSDLGRTEESDISQSIDIYSYPRRIQKIFSRISTLAQKQRFRVFSGENTELKKHRYISVKPLPKQQEKDS